MKNIAIFTVVAIAAILFLESCNPKEKEQKLYFVTINDMHANIDNFPKLAGLLDSLRAVHPDLILMSAGDNRSGNPINDRFIEPSKPIYELMNAVGFDLSCFGCHEWDGGPFALRNVLSWANFPFVCANVSFDSTIQMPNVCHYHDFVRNGLKVGVIGGIQLGENGLPDFHPKNAFGSSFVPLNTVLQNYIDTLNARGCNAIFLLSHCGYEADSLTAMQFPELVAIFGGHSHTLISEKIEVNNVMITQAGSKVNYVTLSTFTIRDGKVIDKDMQLLSVRDFSKRNELVAEMVRQYNNNTYFKTVVANNKSAITSYESLGCLITDAIRFTTDADMAFMHPGGVRYDTLSVRPVTIRDLFALDPFDNEIIHFELTGEEIISLMKCCYVTDGGPIYCSGCSYRYTDEGGEMSNISVVLNDGKPMDMKKKYSVVMDSYMSAVFDFKHEDNGESTFHTSNELLLEYLGQFPDIDYGNVSRITEE